MSKVIFCARRDKSQRYSTFSLLIPLVLGVLGASSGCVGVIRHDEDLAATSAVQFARIAIIDQDYASAFESLSDRGRAKSSAARLQETIMQIHPRGRPKLITAAEFEPLPRQRAMNIYLFGRADDEEFAYKFEMEGTADTGYKVASISRLRTPLPQFATRRPLPNRRSTD